MARNLSGTSARRRIRARRVAATEAHAAGFPTDSPYDELLRLKEVALCRPFGDDFLAGDDLLERTLAEFRKTAPFVQQLNRAVQYAYEEMM